MIDTERPESQVWRWHHASQLQAAVAEAMGLDVRMILGRGWEVYASDIQFDQLVIDAAGATCHER